ncbi:MAG: class I SAM-dependent methyltransferase, partial [Pseudomonadota bacterium]
GIASPACRKATEGFVFEPKTAVDLTLDPFSDAYFDQQIAVYREIAGRALDQDTGEITPIDVDARVNTANPYGENNIAFISKHCRTVLTALMVANPKPGARVLDLGAGWGLSSEMMAYAGAEVTAVDINPAFVELIDRRTARTGLPITAVQGNFDTVEPGQDFDMAFFYECLHHAVRPLDTLKRVADFLGPQGRLVFAGEPVNTIWWPHWGMRLDAESVYVMRKHGWFESGWSAEFICECIRRVGFEPVMLHGIGIDGNDICVADRIGATDMRPLVVPPHTAPAPPPVPHTTPAPAAPVPEPKMQMSNAKRLRRKLKAKIKGLF